MTDTDDIKGAMIDLKLPKRKGGKSVMTEPMYSQEEYPWGFRITFDKTQIAKMKELGTVEAGEQVKFMAIGKVINIGLDTAGIDRDRVEIQLHKVAVKCTGDKKEEKPKGKMSKGKHGQMSYEMED